MGLKGKLIRSGDLCKHTLGYDNGRSVDVWCKVICIRDEFNNIHNEYNIITGRGNKNSKVTLDIKSLSYTDLSTYKNYYGDIKNKTIKNVNPHDVFFHYDYWIKETEDKIEFLKKKKEFLLRNKNILDKISEII